MTCMSFPKKSRQVNLNIVDNNSYVVIYGGYGFIAKGAPKAFVDKLLEVISNNY